MKMFSKIISTTIFLSIFLFLLVDPSYAAGSIKKPDALSDNCKVLAINDINNEQLTKQEELALLDVALNDSIERFGRCEQKNQEKEQAAANNSGGGGGGGAGGGGSGSGSKNSADKADKKPGSKSTTTEAASSAVKQGKPQVILAANGAIPKDIPPADNDTVLQKQIRAAAIKEKDPEKQKKLWEMYRKYKQ